MLEGRDLLLCVRDEAAEALDCGEVAEAAEGTGITDEAAEASDGFLLRTAGLGFVCFWRSSKCATARAMLSKPDIFEVLTVLYFQ
jgi:hypothetical protein